MLVNALHGHLAEFGLVEAQGLHKVARLIAIVMDEMDGRVPHIARQVLKVIVSQIEDFFADFLQKITRPVSEIQLREIMVELAWLNLHLKVRPTFATECDLTGEKCRLVVERPQHVELVQLDRGLRGKLLYGAVRHLLQEVSLLGHSYEEAVALVKSGDLSFLRDDHGQFIEQSWKRL